MRMPLSLRRKAGIIRFARTLSTLLSSAIPITDAMEITARASENRVFEDAITSTLASIESEGSLSFPLSRSGVFPTMATRIIKLGKASGSFEENLDRMADLYEREVDETVTNLTSIMKLAMIVIIGTSIIGFLIISMYLFKLALTIR